MTRRGEIRRQARKLIKQEPDPEFLPSASFVLSAATMSFMVDLFVFGMRGNLYIVSAPSGSGKTTLLQHLLRSFKDLKFSVSHTTRVPRQGERDGVDYYFTDRATFLSMIDRGEFLEWAEFNGELYGTTRAFVDQHLEGGRDVILDIDVQGARQVKAKLNDSTAIFILPPSFEELKRRLQARMLESDDVIRRRLEIAKGEIFLS